MFHLNNISDLIKNVPASEKEIGSLEDKMNIRLPVPYRSLLKNANGFSIAGGVLIYGTEDLIERNETWEVNEYAKGYVAIGDDGGGNVFLMELNAKESKIFVLDCGDMNTQNATIIPLDFNSWIGSGCVSELKELDDSIETCSIVLTASPIGGLKDLVKIKNVLYLKISTFDLLKCSKTLPCELVNEYPYYQAIRQIESLGEIGQVLKVVPFKKDKI
ncbi:SMI1/KNR4 family protein [Lysinibacillus sp. NPDC093216]|uniref:SMI1/KNR4 family protein n=1 Tax=Lysinibacillus sp. NPDC093216 TaxID=3390576 RepID=UPI003CFDD733